MKRIFSLVLCAVLLFGMIPAIDTHAETSSAVVETQDNEVSVSGTNSVGNLLSNEIQQAQEESELAESEYSGGYAVVGLTFTNNVATVEYSSLEEANLIVALYSEDGMQLLTSGNAVVSAEETVATVAIKGTMPQYFMASAYLVDSYDFSPLCPAYDTPMYTQDMQELLASTAEDYDQDRVLNLDDSTETNFAVYTDSVVVIEGGDGVNTVASTDYDNDTYVIENANDQITSLAPDTIIAYPWAEGEVLIVKISTISVDGTTVTITGAEMEIEEVFAYMKLETEGGMDNAEVDTSTCDEGVTYEGIIESSKPATRAWEGGVETEKSMSFKIEKEYGNISVSGGIDLSIKGSFSFYISLKRQFVELKVTPKVALEASITGKLPLLEIELPTIDIYTNVPGVVITDNPSFVLEVNGAVKFEASISMDLGIGFENKKGFQNLCTKPKFDSDISLEGKVYCGIKSKWSVKVFHEDITSVSLNDSYGFQVTGVQKGTDYKNVSEDDKEIHDCTDCLEMSFDFLYEATVEAIFLKFIKKEKKLESKTWHLFKFYKSNDPVNEGSGLGTCPNILYRTTLKVLDKDGTPLSGIQISSVDGDVWGETNKNGILVKYLPFGTHTIIAKSGDQTAEKEVTISEACNINLWFNGISLGTLFPGSIFGKLDTEDCVDEGVYASGTCGENLTWTLSNAGTLTISGTGAMETYDWVTLPPWDSYCTDIRAVVINDGITTIGDIAFANCVNLTSVTIPDSVTGIGNYAFYWCTNLTSVTIGNSVTSIGDYAFCSCRNLNSINIPDSVTIIGAFAFFECEKLLYICVDSGNPAYCNDEYGVLFNKKKTELILVPGGFSGNYTIPHSITTIGNQAFAGCRWLTSINIPNSVTTIGNQAFSGCQRLTSINIPNSVTSIGYRAFESCPNLMGFKVDKDNTAYSTDRYGVLFNKEITELLRAPEALSGSYTIPDSVNVIGDYAFYWCSNLTSVTIGDNVTSIGDYAFYHCSGLTSATIPDSITSIGDSAFELCENLTNIAIPDSVTSIGMNAFTDCIRLEYVVYDNIKYLGNDKNPYAVCAAALNESIFSCTIQPDTRIICDGAFYNCKNLASITIPESVITIGDYAFSGCSSLISIIIPDNVTAIGNHSFAFCSKLTNITIGKNIASIGEGAFYYCSSLTSITIPDSTTSIGALAFYSCSNLKRVVIGRNVSHIKLGALCNCGSLTNVIFRGNAPIIEDGVFLLVTTTIYYPANNPTWTDDVMQDYGGNITWVPYTPTESASDPATKNVAAVNETAAEISQLTTVETVSEDLQDSRPVRGIFGGEYGTEDADNYALKTASFKDLVPGQEYLLLALRSIEAEQPLAASNLLYVDQAAAQDDGTLVFRYVQRESADISYVMVCGVSNKDLNDAVVTFPVMCADDEVQAVNPTVIYDGKTLTEGLDYTIVGTADFTEAGTYTCYIRGIYNYTGLVPCTYTVLDKSIVSAWNLTLSEKISMNFYIDIEEAMTESATVNITLAGETISHQVSDAVIDETSEMYVFTVDLAAAQMKETVTIELFNFDELLNVQSYSIRQYADYVLDDANGFDESIKTLVREMLNYGAMAQVYFDYDAENLANDGITGVAENEVPETADQLTVSDKLDGLNFYGTSLVYRDRIAVRYYFTGDANGCAFVAGGNTYTPVAKDGMYYIEVADILPQDLDRQIILSVTDIDDNTLSVSYAPINYIVRMNEKGSDSLKALLKALYNYHIAAKEFCTAV